MKLMDIVSIVFVSVASNHLGLMSAIEDVIGFRLPVVGCVKCLTFWLVLSYGVGMGADIFMVLAISFLCSWLAIWLDLGMGCIDYLYNMAYDTIYSTAENDTITADTAEDCTADSVS